MTEDNDNTIFDRLADGELNDAERRQLLASLDDREDGWRRCALAFVEGQTWRGHFASFVAEPGDAIVTPTAPPKRTATKIPIASWLTLAAGLVIVAFGVGRASRGVPANGHLANNTPNTIIALNELPTEAAPAEDFAADDAVTLVVRNTKGENQRLRVPLVDFAKLNEQIADTLPADLRARFQDRGFDVRRRRRFAPIFFEQNERLVPMVVPVDDTYLVPVNPPVY